MAIISKQISEIITGKKTQIRKLMNQHTPDFDLHPANPDSKIIAVRKIETRALVWRVGQEHMVNPPVNKQFSNLEKWQPLRIRITHIRWECLQDISVADALAEGVSSIQVYAALWDSQPGLKKAHRWEANPLVWVLDFEVVRTNG